MIGGLFAMYVYPEKAPVDDLTVSASGYEVRMADPLDPAYARGEVARQLAALKELEQRSSGAIRIATSVDELERARSVQQFSMVLHIEGAEAIGADLSGLESAV